MNYRIHFWRTKYGLEVDFVLGEGEVAIAVKGRSLVDNRELRPLAAFADEHKPRAALAVSLEREERVVGNIHVLSWREFLERLWSGKIIS